MGQSELRLSSFKHDDWSIGAYSLDKRCFRCCGCRSLGGYHPHEWRALRPPNRALNGPIRGHIGPIYAPVRSC